MNMNDIFANVRCVVDEKGTKWFSGYDLCKLIGISKASVFIYNNTDMENVYMMFYKDAKGTDFENLWTGRCHVPKLLVNEEGVWQILLNSPNYGKTLKDHLIDNYLIKLSERGLKEIKV